MKLVPVLVAAGLATAFATSVFAESGHGMNHGGDMAMTHTAGQAASGPMAEGTVKKLDKAAGKLTIAHGPLENLGMPGMTMVFRVKDPAMLDQVKAGDKIRFNAERIDGAFTVTELKPAK